MPRGLAPAIITKLGESVFAVETLVEIYFAGSASPTYRYTTGIIDVTIGANTYLANNGITVVGNLIENYQLNQSEFTLQIETSSTALVSTLETNRNNIRIVAYKMFRDAVTNDADTTNLIYLYDSLVDSFTIQGGDGPMTVQMQSRPIFNALDKVKTRTNGDVEPPINVEIVWGSIQWQQ